MKLITTYKYVPAINAYMIQRPNGNIFGWMHTLHHNYFYVDVFDSDGHVIYQNRSRTPDFATVLGSNGVDKKGLVVDDIKLYKQAVPSKHEDPSLIIQHEKKHYIPGLERLKAFGYKVTKIL